MLSSAILRKISQEIHRRFPETAGAQPTVRSQKPPHAGDDSPTNYLLSFRGKARTADQKNIQTIIRVVVNDQGRILKISSSRG